MNSPRPRPLSSRSASPSDAPELLEQPLVLDAGRRDAFVLDPEREPAALGARVRRCGSMLSGGANLLAFASRFTSTCVRRCWSPRMTGTSLVRLDLDALTALRDQRLDQLARRDDDVVEHDVLMANRELAGLDAHALEQIVDEPRQALRAALQRRDELALRRRRSSCRRRRAAARSRRAAPRAACGTRARCWRAPCRACGARPRARSRRAAPAPASRRPPAARSR